jgi:hypothetical protein
MPIDIELRRAKARAVYKANPAPAKARASINKKRNRTEFAAFKATLSCTKCGENHPSTLDFHHHTPHPSNIKINELLRSGRISFAIEEIMSKCTVLCSNCHRVHHWEERKGAKAP